MIEDSTEDGRDPSDEPPGAKPHPDAATPGAETWGTGPSGAGPSVPAGSAEAPGAGASNVARLHPPRIPHHPTLDRAVQGMIGAQLRSMYEHYIEQPIPDRLLELVQRLGADAGSGTQDDGGVQRLGADAGNDAPDDGGVER
jgi:hypothetical protein